MSGKSKNDADTNLITAMIEAGREPVDDSDFAQWGVLLIFVLSALLWGALGAALSQLL